MSRILIVGTNWIGDSVMSMPAVQALRRAHADAHIAMLVKPALVPMWKMHAAPDDVMCLDEGPMATMRAAREVTSGGFNIAYVLPHSFRAALVPFLARVPVRIGMPGHARDWMLTRVVKPPVGNEARHQAYEYVSLMVPEGLKADLDQPLLDVPDEAEAKALDLLSNVGAPRVAFLPGAARGPSKRWPQTHFEELGVRLAQEAGCGVVLLGTAAERELCEDVAAKIGDVALNLAGRSGLPEWMALLDACDAVVCNDSGGMHVAAAVGTPLVAIYGMTDPTKTGPIGSNCRILHAEGERARDIARHSQEAMERLASIRPERVYDAVVEALESPGSATGDV